MPVTTAAITSKRARRARRKEPTNYYCSSSQPCTHSELLNPAAFQWTEGSSRKSLETRPFDCGNVGDKKVRVVTLEGDVNMEEGEARTPAMTHSNPDGGSRSISTPSSNESSPTTTRAPNIDDTPQGVERSFKRRRSFSKSHQVCSGVCIRASWS